MYTDATKKAVQKYNKKAYDTFIVRVSKGTHEKIKAIAKKRGLSLNGYILDLIQKDSNILVAKKK